jgi:hypothetical protein
MIGIDFVFWFIGFQLCLVDLFDLRYNNERSLILIPTVSLSWVGKGEEMIFSIILTWLNLELSLIMYNIDYYYDKLEHFIEEHFKKEEEKDENKKE